MSSTEEDGGAAPFCSVAEEVAVEVGCERLFPGEKEEEEAEGGGREPMMPF